jgi:hypothetical protein
MSRGMKIYVYGIIDSNDGMGESVYGLKGTDVYNIPYRDIGVAASNLNGQVRDITQDSAVEHERVVEKLMINCAVLPVKFRTVFASREDILSMMKNYYSDFRANLDRLRDKVEFGIKIIWPGEAIRERMVIAYNKGGTNTDPAGPDLDGRLADSPAKRFLMKAFKNYKIDEKFKEKADRCVAVVDHLFSRVAIEKRLEKLRTDNLLLNAVYLVDKSRQDDFREMFEYTRHTYGGLKYLFSGPWPPYNFVGLRGGLNCSKQWGLVSVFDEASRHENVPQGVGI